MIKLSQSPRSNKTRGNKSITDVQPYKENLKRTILLVIKGRVRVWNLANTSFCLIQIVELGHCRSVMAVRHTPTSLIIKKKKKTRSLVYLEMSLI